MLALYQVASWPILLLCPLIRFSLPSRLSFRPQEFFPRKFSVLGGLRYWVTSNSSLRFASPLSLVSCLTPNLHPPKARSSCRPSRTPPPPSLATADPFFLHRVRQTIRFSGPMNLYLVLSPVFPPKAPDFQSRSCTTPLLPFSTRLFSVSADSPQFLSSSTWGWVPQTRVLLLVLRPAWKNPALPLTTGT